MIADADLIDRFGAHQLMRGFTAATVRRRRWTLRNLTIESAVGLAAIEERHVVAFLSRRTAATTRRAHCWPTCASSSGGGDVGPG